MYDINSVLAILNTPAVTVVTILICSLIHHWLTDYPLPV